MATDRLDEKQLAEIEARANAATPGPWLRSERDRLACTYDVQREDRYVIATIDDAEGDDPTPDFLHASEDASFIASARADVPALVAEVRRLRAELADATRRAGDLVPEAAFYDE